MELVSNPQYVGYWIIGRGIDAPKPKVLLKNDYSKMRLFIDEKTESDNGIFDIRGRIKDSYGRSTLIGQMSSDFIMFIKEYEEGKCKPNAIMDPFFYSGTIWRRKYCGKEYRHYRGVWECYKKGNLILNGGFIIEKYYASLLLEFLMRMDKK